MTNHARTGLMKRLSNQKAIGDRALVRSFTNEQKILTNDCIVHNLLHEDNSTCR